MTTPLKTVADRLAARHRLPVGPVGDVLLFLLAVHLLGTATEPAAPTLRGPLRRVGAGDPSPLGAGWLGAYFLGNGSVGVGLRYQRIDRRRPMVKGNPTLGSREMGTCRRVLAWRRRTGNRMNFDEFTGQVHHRLELPGTGETVRAIRATLMTLGQRIQAREAEDLASSLPMEIGWYLTGAVREHGERFDWSEFVARVAEIEGVDPPEAAYHAQVIIDLVSEAVPSAELEQIRDQLPQDEDDENWGMLFTLVDAGGWRERRTA